MLIVINTIRHQPSYRRVSFDVGLGRLGYKIVTSGNPKSRKDILLIWNRQGVQEVQANAWELNGGTVVVAENGYVGADDHGCQLYAVAAHGHNGSGFFPVGNEDRFTPLGIDLMPWCDGQGWALVAAQRGIGSRLMASPPGWEDKTFRQLKAMGVRNIKIRQHPGKVPAKTTLDQDLEGARICVTWASASGVKALTRGVPVVYCAPHWICEGAAGHGVSAIDKPVRDDVLRRDAMHRMSHGQWRIDEIERGEPFARIMEHIGSAVW